MDLNTFIVAVFCLIDDRIADLGDLRERGPTTTLYDSEVLTIEVVGEFLGIDEDTELSLVNRETQAPERVSATPLLFGLSAYGAPGRTRPVS